MSQSSSAVCDLPARRDQDLEPDVGSCSAGSNRKRAGASRSPFVSVADRPNRASARRWRTRSFVARSGSESVEVRRPQGRGCPVLGAMSRRRAPASGGAVRVGARHERSTSSGMRGTVGSLGSWSPLGGGSLGGSAAACFLASFVGLLPRSPHADRILAVQLCHRSPFLRARGHAGCPFWWNAGRRGARRCLDERGARLIGHDHVLHSAHGTKDRGVPQWAGTLSR